MVTPDPTGFIVMPATSPIELSIDDGSGPVGVTSPTQFDSLSYELKAADGTSLGTGPLEESENPAHPVGPWRAKFNVPPRPNETVHVHVVVTKGRGRWPWHGTIQVQAFA